MERAETLARRTRRTPSVRRWILLSVALLAFGSAHAQSTLEGTVSGRDGRPKAHVSVDLVGPTTVYAETASDGKFTVGLRPGRYVVRIRDYRRRQEFRQQVQPGANRGTYQVSW